MTDKREPVTQHLVDSVLHLLINDTSFLSAINGLVPEEFFPCVLSERIAGLCFRYFDAFRQAPGSHYDDELARVLGTLRDDDRERMLDLSERLVALPPPDPQYVLSRINDFMRSRELERAAIDVARLVDQGSYTEAEIRMSEALSAGVERENIGLNYFSDPNPMVRRFNEGQPVMGTGWDLLDKKIGGFHRQRFVIVLGKYKGKKSWVLINMARAALVRGLTVVHITHEMTAAETEARYDRMFGSLVSREDLNPVKMCFWNHKKGRFESFSEPRPTIYNASAVLKARRAMRGYGGKLIIRKYPMGACTMLEVSRYLNYLERFENIVPDVLINDYADIMAPIDSKQQTRDAINESYIFHKRLADERDMVVITATQARRESLDRPKFSIKDVAEDIRKVANCDLAIGVSALEDATGMEKARCVLLASRDSGHVGADFHFGMCLDLGQVVTWERETMSIMSDDDQERGRENV